MKFITLIFFVSQAFAQDTSLLKKQMTLEAQAIHATNIERVAVDPESCVIPEGHRKRLKVMRKNLLQLQKMGRLDHCPQLKGTDDLSIADKLWNEAAVVAQQNGLIPYGSSGSTSVNTGGTTTSSSSSNGGGSSFVSTGGTTGSSGSSSSGSGSSGSSSSGSTTTTGGSGNNNGYPTTTESGTAADVVGAGRFSIDPALVPAPAGTADPSGQSLFGLKFDAEGTHGIRLFAQEEKSRVCRLVISGEVEFSKLLNVEYSTANIAPFCKNWCENELPKALVGADEKSYLATCHWKGQTLFEKKNGDSSKHGINTTPIGNCVLGRPRSYNSSYETDEVIWNRPITYTSECVSKAATLYLDIDSMNPPWTSQYVAPLRASVVTATDRKQIALLKFIGAMDGGGTSCPIRGMPNSFGGCLENNFVGEPFEPITQFDTAAPPAGQKELCRSEIVWRLANGDRGFVGTGYTWQDDCRVYCKKWGTDYVDRTTKDTRFVEWRAVCLRKDATQVINVCDYKLMGCRP